MGSDRFLLDVNAFAIFLVEDHPGNRYVSAEIEPGLHGDREILVLDYLPLRAHHVMTHRWGIDGGAASRAVESLVDSRIEVVSADRSTILDAFRMADRWNHDVYLCFYLALAKKEGATHLLTTDRDFESLCHGEEVQYLNPVPDEILKKFSGV